MSKYLLLDGNSILYRAYYATYKIDLRNSNNFPVGCLNLFILTIEKYLDLYNPDYLAIAFDHGKETFRTKEYQDYKKTRPPMPSDLYLQLKALYDYLTLRNLPILSLKDYEADDIIGTLQKQILKIDKLAKIIIVSSDQDILQLVNDQTTVLRIVSGFSNLKSYNINNFSENYYNLEPLQVPLFKALSGDSSDNVCGIKGIGPKTAIKIIKEYKDIINIYQNIDKLSSRTNLLLADNFNNLTNLEKLLTIYRDVPIKYELNSLQILPVLNEPDYKNIINFLNKYELNLLIKKFQEKYQNSKIINVIDLGSQLFKLDIYLVKDSNYKLLKHESINNRNIKYLDSNNNLSKIGIDNIISTIKLLLDNINENNTTLIFATEFLRKAKNNLEIIKEIKNKLNINLEILKSEDECQLNYLAFKNMAKIFKKDYLVIDIGGGSIEFICIDENGNKLNNFSLPIGIIVVKKLFLDEINYKNIYNFYFEKISSLNLNKITIMISGSGSMYTVLNIIKYFNKSFNKNLNYFSKIDLKLTLNKILHLSQKQIDEIEVLEASRKDLIKHIFIFLTALADNLGLEKFYVSSLNIRVGYLIKKGFYK